MGGYCSDPNIKNKYPDLFEKQMTEKYLYTYVNNPVSRELSIPYPHEINYKTTADLSPKLSFKHYGHVTNRGRIII